MADDPTPVQGPNKALIVLAVLLVVGAFTAAAWYWTRERPSAGAAQPLEPNMPRSVPAPAQAPATPEAPPPPAAPKPPAETFDRRATIQGVDHADVRDAPSESGDNIARVEPGEVFATYEQEGDWWRVRTASGRIGYMNMALIRLRGAAAPARVEAQPAPAKARRPARAGKPRSPPPRTRIRKENSDVMDAFCAAEGQGTPQCRAFERSNY